MVALSMPTGAETLATSQNGEVGLPGRLKKKKKKVHGCHTGCYGRTEDSIRKSPLKRKWCGKRKAPPTSSSIFLNTLKLPSLLFSFFVFFCPRPLSYSSPHLVCHPSLIVKLFSSRPNGGRLFLLLYPATLTIGGRWSDGAVARWLASSMDPHAAASLNSSPDSRGTLTRVAHVFVWPSGWLSRTHPRLRANTRRARAELLQLSLDSLNLALNLNIIISTSSGSRASWLYFQELTMVPRKTTSRQIIFRKEKFHIAPMCAENVFGIQ